MPVRRKAIDVIADHHPESAEQLYVTLVESIDWSRVVLEATGRCLRVHDNEDIDTPCGECVHAAMLAENTFPDWDKPTEN